MPPPPNAHSNHPKFIPTGTPLCRRSIAPAVRLRSPRVLFALFHPLFQVQTQFPDLTLLPPPLNHYLLIAARDRSPRHNGKLVVLLVAGLA